MMRFNEPCPTARLKHLMRECDLDGNGYISFDEFIVYMDKHTIRLPKNFDQALGDAIKESAAEDAAEAARDAEGEKRRVEYVKSKFCNSMVKKQQANQKMIQDRLAKMERLDRELPPVDK